jgi:hypothetical protein
MPRHFRIHPAIGVARMGNSPEHFIASELPGLPANSDDGVTFKSFRDSKGLILRQGARFRVYEYSEDANGDLSNPREVSIGADVLDIEWRVHLANRKASFYTFYGQVGANDLYVSRRSLPPDTKIKRTGDDPQRDNVRNSNVTSESDRSSRLDIDPGEKMVNNAQQGPLELLNPNTQIPIKSLGTLLFEPPGRLVVLGGYGESNSTEDPPRVIDEYANNDTWFDDASDGSIKARIRLQDGSAVDADAAWVLVGPPKFAPGIGTVVSLFDTLWDTAIREVDFLPSTPRTSMLSLLLEQKQVWKDNASSSLAGFKPSFTRDIYPLLKRAAGARDCHVSGTTGNPHFHQRLLGDWATLSSLSGPNAAEGTKLRKGVLPYLRDPDDSQAKWDKMPRGLGDEYTALDANPASPSPRSFLSLTRIQYAMLREWANDSFVDDWPGSEPVALPKPNPTPDDLDCAALENCVGGPFYPGIEVSWLIRVKDLFFEPFRLKVPREPAESATTKAALITTGALEFRPGFFSQQMALPWQADFYDCHKERWEDPDGNEYYFMWWTAQRPDDVFPSGQTQQKRWVRIFDDPTKTAEENEDDLARFKQMQSRWFDLKFVSARNGAHYEEEA